MATKRFSEYVEDKSFDEILHEGRRESMERIFSEALTPLTLLLSQELHKTPDEVVAELEDDGPLD